MESSSGNKPKRNPLSFFNYGEGDHDSEETEEEEKDDREPKADEENPFSFKLFAADAPPTRQGEASPKTNRRRPAKPSPPPAPVPASGAASRSVLDFHNSDELAPGPGPTPVAGPSVCLECRRLSKENKRLRSKLQESLDTAAAVNKRVEKLSAQLKARDERETLEASQLEQMLRQVERNLQRSTKRADEAERTVERLSRELAHLRAQQSSQGAQRRTGEVGAELVETSKSARHMLKQLLRGVERLSVVGESLQADAKFSDAS